MNISALNNSFRFSLDINFEGCVEAIAEAASNAAFNATKSILDRAIADSRKVIEAGRVTRQVSDAIAQSTVIRAEVAIADKIVIPVRRVKNAIVSPVNRAWETSLDLITDYLESTPVKAAPVIESLPAIAADFDFEASLAAVRDEIAAKNEINQVFSEEWAHKAIDAAEKGHVLVGDKVITEDGFVAVTDTVEEVKPKASALSGMIREEVAKH